MTAATQAFLAQARACAALESPFTARVLRAVAALLEADAPGLARIRDWQGALGPSGDSVPLRLAGGLHRLVLAGMDGGLAARYPPADTSDATLRQAIAAALLRHAKVLDRWLDSPPQTNEVRRSVALIATAHWLRQRFDLPLRLSELGASAGLNLAFQRYRLKTPSGDLGPADAALTLTPDWRGTVPAPSPAPVTVTERAGVDLDPVRLADAADRLRLMSYLWADQPWRRTATLAAIRTLRALPHNLAQGDAAPWLEDRLATPVPGTLHLVYHTIAWQYFPPATADRCRAALLAAGATATPEAPLAWLGMEADGSPDGAALTLRLWPADTAWRLGRIDFHGRWIDWHPQPD